MKHLVLILILCGSWHVNAKEFLYPTAVDPQRSVVYLIYQKTVNHLELWEWNYVTGYASPLLPSRFTPAGFCILPSGNGFSFIDRGSLKVKQFIKRSPRNIEFDAPIFSVEIVHWLDDRTCYTFGKYNEHYGIFHIDYDGRVSPLCMSDSVDCMYPQKVGDDLFYIERDSQWNYRIMKRDYHLSPDFRAFAERKAWYAMQTSSEQEVLVGENSIIFLSMLSADEGFFIAHPKLVNTKECFVPFSYHHLKKGSDNKWSSKILFTFSIPTGFFLLGNELRLYEALLPLLPRHANDLIFYVNAIEGDLGICAYDIRSETSRVVRSMKDQSFFSPHQVGQELFCGGFMKQEIRMEWEEEGVVAGLFRFSLN